MEFHKLSANAQASATLEKLDELEEAELSDDAESAIALNQSSFLLSQQERLQDTTRTSINDKNCNLRPCRPSSYQTSSVKPRIDSDTFSMQSEEEEGQPRKPPVEESKQEESLLIDTAAVVEEVVWPPPNWTFTSYDEEKQIRYFENPLPYDVAKCQFAEGKWCKWVIERCDEEQLSLYNQMCDKIDAVEDPQMREVLQKVSVNKKLRLLQGWKWKLQAAFDGLFNLEKHLIDNECLRIDIKEIQPVIDQKVFCAFGFDKVGRPNLYVSMQRFIPSELTTFNTQKFMVALFDYVSVYMPPHIDSMNVIYDFTNLGRRNFQSDIAKGLADVSGRLYTGRMNRFYVTNLQSWSARMIWNIFYALIPERGRQKICFPPQAEQNDVMLAEIDEAMLCKEFGGTGPSMFDLMDQHHYKP